MEEEVVEVEQGVQVGDEDVDEEDWDLGWDGI